MYIGKKIKIKDKLYNIKVGTYKNGRLRIKYIDKKESHDITVNIDDAYLMKDHIFLDPSIMGNGIYKELKKNKIVKEIVGILNSQYVEVPIAQVNMGILRNYDKNGVKYFLNKEVMDEE